MYIEEYEPGLMLLLRHHKDETIPLSGCLVFAFVIALGVLLVVVIASVWYVSLACIVILAIVLGVALLFTPGFLIECEANAGNKKIGAKAREYWFRERDYEYPFSQLVGFSLRHERALLATEDIAKEKGTELPLTLTLQYQPENQMTPVSTSFNLKIKDVDSREKILDFGKRLAHILQMTGNMEKNNPTICEIRFSKQKENQPNPIDTNLDFSQKKPLAELYAQDEVPPDKILSEIVCEEWNPKMHSLAYDVIEYTPQHKIVLDLRYGKLKSWLEYFWWSIVWGAGIALLPLTVMLVLKGKLEAIAAIETIATFWPYFAILPGILVCITSVYWAWRKIRRELSHDFCMVALDKKLFYPPRSRPLAPYFDKPVPLYEAKQVVLRRYEVKKYKTYNAKITLTGIPDIPELLVGMTAELTSQQDTYYAGLYFASIFVKALKIPFVFEDMIPKHDEDLD